MEGELVAHLGKKQRALYAMMEGSLLFLLEPSKALRPLEEGEKGRHHTRFTWARSILASQALHVRSFTRLFRRDNASFTSTTQHAADIEFGRRASNIVSALAVIDLSGATKVRRVSSEQPTTFTVTMTTSCDLQFETTTMHSMFEWIQRIQRLMQGARLAIPWQLCERSVLVRIRMQLSRVMSALFNLLY